MNARVGLIRSAHTAALLATLLVGATPFGTAVAAVAVTSPFATPSATPSASPTTSQSLTSSRASTLASSPDIRSPTALPLSAATSPPIAQSPTSALTSAATSQVLTADLTPSPAQSPTSSPESSSTPPAPPPSAAGSNAPTEDIRDIRGPKYIFPVWLLLVLLAGALLLAFGGYAAWRRQQRRRRPRALLPFEVALQRLEEIRPLMQPATAREFSTAASDIVRRYIEQRFDVTATHQTTEEFLRDLLDLAKPSLAMHRGLLSEFLHQCDLVKFAGISLSTQSMESLHQSARAFILETAKPDAATQIGQPSSIDQSSSSSAAHAVAATGKPAPSPIHDAATPIATPLPSSIKTQAAGIAKPLPSSGGKLGQGGA